jgi:hypothetical protein
MIQAGKTCLLSRQALGGIAAACAVVMLLASPALSAAAFFGNATIRPAVHGSGRTLSGQGVEMVAGKGAATGGGVISLPIDSLEVGGTAPGARTAAALSFRHGKRSLTLTGIAFAFETGAIEGSLGGRRLTVFRLGTALDIYPTTRSVLFVGGRLRLTDAAARLLKARLGLERALAPRGVGEVSMGATETTPLPPGCNPPPRSGDPTGPPPPPGECVPIPPDETPPQPPPPGL